MTPLHGQTEDEDSDAIFDFDSDSTADDKPVLNVDTYRLEDHPWIKGDRAILRDLQVVPEPVGNTLDLLGPPPLGALPTDTHLDSDSEDEAATGIAGSHGLSRSETKPTKANVRKRRASASAADQNDAPGTQTTKRVKRGLKALPRLNTSHQPDTSSSSLTPARGAITTVVDDARGRAGQPIVAGTRGRLRQQCLSPPDFVWDSTGKLAICQYSGPGHLPHKDGRRPCDPLRLDGKGQTDRLSRHHLSHQTLEARAIAGNVYGFDKAHIIKNQAQLQMAFDSLLRCPRCRCSCEQAGNACADSIHGVHFTRAEKLKDHLDANKCVDLQKDVNV